MCGPLAGAIFRAWNIHNQTEVALKLQPVNEPCPTNRYERGFYPALQGGKGMPTLWASGVQGPWDYLAIDLLGRSLDSLHRELMMKQEEKKRAVSGESTSEDRFLVGELKALEPAKPGLMRIQASSSKQV